LNPPTADSPWIGKLLPYFFLPLSFSDFERIAVLVFPCLLSVAKAANRQSCVYAVLLGYGQDRFSLAFLRRQIMFGKTMVRGLLTAAMFACLHLTVNGDTLIFSSFNEDGTYNQPTVPTVFTISD